MKINKELLKGNTEIFVLSLLNKEEMYGYEIAKKMREKIKEAFEVKEGTVYVVLKRLEEKNLIYSFWKVEEENKGARRKYFAITKQGRFALDDKIQEWKLISQIMDLFLEVEK